MTKLPGRGLEASGNGWERLSMASVVAASALAWLVAVGGLITTLLALPGLGWHRVLSVVALCAAPPSALWMTRRAAAARHIRTAVPLPMLQQRSHGSLESITDSGRRPLRPIAATAYEVAVRTEELLTDLTAIPSVRIFHALRPEGVGLPLIPHALSAGRSLIFIESVAWPSGHYETKADGKVHCDGTYIGQSVRPLLDAVQHWRAKVPKRHRVRAMVIVHVLGEGDITLPARSPDGLMWVHADDAAAAIRQHMLPGGKTVSRNVLAKLIAATSEQA